jgi:hypothetical protein
MSGAPFKKLPASPSVSSSSVPVADRGGEEVNVGFSDFGAGSGNQLRDPRARRVAGNDCRTVLKSVLTQLWCTCGTCGTLAGIDDKSVISRKPLLRSEQRDTSPRVRDGSGWIMEAHGQNSAVCPGCQSISHSRHSRYWRSLKDLPVQGTQVILRLHLGRWRCRNAGCQRRIFTERLSKVCAPYAQQTKRTSEINAAMGHALGGRPGQRLMSRLGMPVSADTLIRQVKRAAYSPALPQVRVLGVDDWAWCKGQTFGTILVDLERSQVVDLLPTRSTDSLGEWLAQHPEVTTISRDRQGVYAEPSGSSRGHSAAPGLTRPISRLPPCSSQDSASRRGAPPSAQADNAITCSCASCASGLSLRMACVPSWHRHGKT